MHSCNSRYSSITGKENPWLLVLDNLDDPDESYMLQVTSWIPQAPLGNVIITTRLRAWQMHSSKTIELSSLSKVEAIQLLGLWIGPADYAASERVVSRLGCHALAVNQAGAFISKEFGVNVEHYLEYYDLVRKELMQYGPRHVADWNYWKYAGENGSDTEAALPSESSRPASVLSTWELSFRHLQKIYPDAARLLSLMSFLERTNVTVDIICKGALSEKRFNYQGVFENYHPSMSGVSPWLVELLDGQTPRGQALKINFLMNRLLDFSLIQCTSSNNEESTTTTGQRFWIHPLMHDWARIRLKEDEAAVLAVEAMALISHSIDDSDHFLYTHESNATLLPHIDFAFPALTKFLSNTRVVGEQRARLLKIAYRFGSLYRVHSRWAQSDVLFELVWISMRQALDPDALGPLKSIVGSIDLIFEIPNEYSSSSSKKLDGVAASGLDTIQLHDIIPLLHSKAISVYHQGNIEVAASIISFLTQIHDLDHARLLQFQIQSAETTSSNRALQAIQNRLLSGACTSPGQECICFLETLCLKSKIYEYREETIKSAELITKAYLGFKSILGPNHPRTLLGGIVYLSTTDPDLTKEELGSFIVKEFERLSGPEASITLYAKVCVRQNYDKLKDPEAKVKFWENLFDLCKRTGTYSPDPRIPILDDSTLRIMTGLGWAKISLYSMHDNDAAPPVKLLAEAKELGLRAFENLQRIEPFSSPFASELIGDAFYWERGWNDAEYWYRLCIDMHLTNGGNGNGRLVKDSEQRIEEIKEFRVAGR